MFKKDIKGSQLGGKNDIKYKSGSTKWKAKHQN